MRLNQRPPAPPQPETPPTKTVTETVATVSILFVGGAEITYTLTEHEFEQYSKAWEWSGDSIRFLAGEEEITIQKASIMMRRSREVVVSREVPLFDRGGDEA